MKTVACTLYAFDNMIAYKYNTDVEDLDDLPEVLVSHVVPHPPRAFKHAETGTYSGDGVLLYSATYREYTCESVDIV